MIAAPMAVGLTALGTGVGVAAQLSAAEAQKNVLYQNAEMARLAGKDAVRRGMQAAGQSLAAGSRAVGSARAAAAASGADVYSGSVIDILGTTRLMSKLDAETAQVNAASEAWSRGLQAQNFANEAGSAGIKGTWGAGSTLLGGATNVLSTGYSMGLFPKFG